MLSVVTNGLVLPLLASVIRTAALTVMLPIVQRDMAALGQPQAEIDAVLGNFLVMAEVALALPAITLLMRNPSLGAAVGSAFTLMALEVFGKQKKPTSDTIACATRAIRWASAMPSTCFNRVLARQRQRKRPLQSSS